MTKVQKHEVNKPALFVRLILSVTIGGMLFLLWLNGDRGATKNALPAMYKGTNNSEADTVLLLFKIHHFNWVNDTTIKGYYKYDITD